MQYPLTVVEPIALIRLIQIFINTVCALSDNWYYLGKVGIYKWSSPNEEHLAAMLASATALISLAIDIVNEISTILVKV